MEIPEFFQTIYLMIVGFFFGSQVVSIQAAMQTTAALQEIVGGEGTSIKTVRHYPIGGGQMKIDVINILIAITSIALVIVTFYIGGALQQSNKGTSEGVIATEIKHLRDDVTEIKGMMTASVGK